MLLFHLIATTLAVSLLSPMGATAATDVESCELRCADLFVNTYPQNHMKTGCMAACAPANATLGTVASASTCLHVCLMRFSPSSDNTLEERGGCTTGCALNVIAQDDRQLEAAVAEVRAEEDARALTEAHTLNKTVVSLVAREDARASQEAAELQDAIAAVRAVEDARALQEALVLNASLAELVAAEDARALAEAAQLAAGLAAERAYEDERYGRLSATVSQEIVDREAAVANLDTTLSDAVGLLEDLIGDVEKDLRKFKRDSKEKIANLTSSYDALRSEHDTLAGFVHARQPTTSTSTRRTTRDTPATTTTTTTSTSTRRTTRDTPATTTTTTTTSTQQPAASTTRDAGPCTASNTEGTCKCKEGATIVFRRNSAGDCICRCLAQ